MKKTVHDFLIQFTSAYRSNKPYLIVKNTSDAAQCLTIFKTLGIISHYNPLKTQLDYKLASGINPMFRFNYLIVWFHVWPVNFTLQGQQPGAVIEQSPHVPHSKGAHKLEIIRYPSRRHYTYITHQKLKRKLPHYNTIYLLQSTRGIITSNEALKTRTGGIPLLAIYL